MLPIELLNFSGIYENNIVQLYWTTSSEKNNDYFTIERSIDAVNFNIITIVKGAGNSTKTLSYSTEDFNPPQGTIYYRLKQTDFNGFFTYSNVIAVKTKIDSLGLLASQPFYNGNVIETFVKNIDNNSLKVEITTITGSRVFSEIYHPTQNDLKLNINTSGLVKGTLYFMKINNEKETVVKKFTF